MSDFKKVENKKKRRNDQPNIKSVDDQELRNYLVKKLKINAEERDSKDIIAQQADDTEVGIINITNNGKSKIKKLVNQGMNTLQQVKCVTMQAKDKSISKLVSVIEIIKQTIGKSNITQKNHIFNMQDLKCKKQAFMKISLIYNSEKETPVFGSSNA